MIYDVALHSTLRIIVGIVGIADEVDRIDRIDRIDKVDKVDKRKPTIEWAFLIHCLRMNFIIDVLI
ncbi:hypothetical protein B9T19_09995 [Ignatzschineria sp. F8392]|nr:hypothetical protein B9T19_09995 [Ignatzschineria sp. F8392]